MKEKIKKFFSWILSECKDGKTLILLIIVMAVIYSPVWGGYLAHLLFGWKLGSSLDE